LDEDIEVFVRGRTLHVGRYKAAFGLAELSKIRNFANRAEQASATAQGIEAPGANESSGPA
jgi:hypothetical protein